MGCDNSGTATITEREPVMAKPRKPHERRSKPKRWVLPQNERHTSPIAGTVYRETPNLIKGASKPYKKLDFDKEMKRRAKGATWANYISGHDPEKSAAYWAPKFRRSEGQKRRAKTTGKPIDWSGRGLGRRKK